jgi:hypothetical protein
LLDIERVLLANGAFVTHAQPRPIEQQESPI